MYVCMFGLFFLFISFILYSQSLCRRRQLLQNVWVSVMNTSQPANHHSHHKQQIASSYRYWNFRIEYFFFYLTNNSY